MSGIRTTILLCGLLLAGGDVIAQNWVDHTTANNSNVIKRHETGSVVNDNKLYVLGGRGNKPVQVFDSSSNRWNTLAPLPLELHHFQPVVHNGYLYVIGAFTCCYPVEDKVSDIYRLNLANNSWEIHGQMPTARLRGSAGTVVYNNKIYLIGGNTNGHSGGAVDWFDEYDPATGNWRILDDAPNARDHFSAAMVGNRLVAAGGRKTAGGFGGMVAATDVYNFATNNWKTGEPIPTPRAGTMLGVKSGNVIVIGGETDTQVESHDEVEAYDVINDTWRTLPALDEGRHGGAGGTIGNTLHAITGNLFRGGGNEVTTHEKLNVSDTDNDGLFNFEDNTNDNTQDSDNDGLTDLEEQQLQTDAQNPDSDNDGLSDGEEVMQYNTDPRSSDTDNDGLSDIDELQTYKTDPTKKDTDGDSLTDGDELQQHSTDPLLRDSDNDGLEDNVEIETYGSNPNAWDSDGDGVSDATEAAEGTGLNNDDEDNDGITNIAEGSEDADGDTVPDFKDLDSDNDGIPDLVENGRPDNNNDGMLDSATDTASAELFDADGDGIANYLDLDSDQDGLSDLSEFGQPDSPTTGRVIPENFIDANNNGWHDPLEGLAVPDTDGDATPDFLDLDSDDDGTADTAESNVIDTDNDGMIDEITDENSDGIDDELEGQVTDAQSKKGGGSDPLLPAYLLGITLLAMRRRYPGSNQGN